MPPAKKSRTPGGGKGITGPQLKRIWGEMKGQVLLERLKALQPGARWSGGGARLQGCCPFHDESTPSFHIYLDRGYAKCFGCEKFVWNPLEFWAHIRGGGKWSEALVDLRQTFGLKFLTASAGSELSKWERNQLLKKTLVRICHEELIKAISSPQDPAYSYAKATVNYLVNTRKLPVDAIPTLSMLGVVPPVAKILDILRIEADEENRKRTLDAEQNNERVEKFISFEAEAKEYITSGAGWIGSLIFRLDTAPDAIGRLKLRRPDTKDFLVLPDAFDDELGFFGLSWSMYAPLFGGQQKYAWPYIVEGEFDALSIMARQVKTGSANFLVLAAGGSAGGASIDTLSHFGFTEAFLVGDAPSKKGDELIEHWLPSVQKLRTKIFTGYDQFPGQGDPDEIVVTHGLQALQTAFLDTKNPQMFMSPQDWVFEHAQPELEAVTPGDTRHMVEVAGNWGRLIKNQIECDAFIAMCVKNYNVHGTSLKREIAAREETEPAFILRVVSVLQEIFFIIGQEALENDRRLSLWHKEKKLIVQLSLADDGSVERELGSVLGTSYQLFEERIGVPVFLEPSPEQRSGKYLQKQDRDYRWYLRQALILMAQNSPDVVTSQHMGQGIHVVRHPQGMPPTVYLVNGRDVYHGEFNEVKELVWTLLEGPSHNGIIFDVGIKHEEKPWLPWVKSAEDLTKAKQLSLKECWENLHKALDIGWRYKNHAITTDFLAAHLLAATVCKTFRRQVIVAFHADTRAGKSKMVMGLIGGTDFPQANLIAAAVGIPNFTAAGVRQAMNDKARPLCLDEFEDEGGADKKSRTIVETLEMFRNLLGEDNRVVHGSRGGEPVTWRLNFFLFLSSINQTRKVQDANRMLTVFMERVDDRADPIQILGQEFGTDRLAELRQQLSLVMLPYIAELQAIYNDIAREFGVPGGKPTSIDSRVFEALYPSLSVMKLMGHDYKKFINDYCEANKEMLTLTAGHTDSMALFDWLTQTSNLKIRVGERNDRNDASVLQLLMTPETRHEINLSGSGLFYDEPSESLVVNWTTAIQKVLVGHARYGKETNILNLRELANRVPHALKPSELEKSGAMNRLKSFGLVGVTAHQVTGYRMSHIIRQLSSVPAPVLPPEPEKKIEEPPRKEVEGIDNDEFGN